MAILDTLFGTPQSTMLGGLLGNEQMDNLRQQALTSGLINTAIGYLAQPKNQRFGSALPYVARALVAGQQGAQGVYDDALRSYQSQLQLAELQRKQEQQKGLQEMLGGIEDPQERLFAQLAPEQYVTQKLKPRQQQAFAILTPDQSKAYGLPTDRGQRYQMTENGVQLISGTEQKEASGTTLNKLLTERDAIAKDNPNDPRLKYYDNMIQKETSKSEGININYGSPVAAVDAQGNPVFIQPSKTGGAPAVVSGFAPEAKAPTESQAKAEAFGSQMQSASKEFENIIQEGFTPSDLKSQLELNIAGTPARIFANPLAQRAQQSQEQWAEAYLRYKTGAAATESEVKRNIATYFPKIGETDPKVIEQKARMRKQAEQDVLRSAKPRPQAKQPAQSAPAGRSRAEILKQYGL